MVHDVHLAARSRMIQARSASSVEHRRIAAAATKRPFTDLFVHSTSQDQWLIK